MNYPSDFEVFWRAYPPRWSEAQSLWAKKCKGQAYDEWFNLNDEDKELAMKAAGDVEQGMFTWDARRWLKRRRWEDEIIDAPPPVETSNDMDKTRLLPLIGKNCSVEKCKLPAVYNDTSGTYSHYKCTKHMPSAVKEGYK